MDTGTARLKDREDSNRNYIIKILAEKGYFGSATKSFNEVGSSLELETTIPYQRTTTEYRLLDRIAKTTRTKITTRDVRDGSSEKRIFEIRDFQERPVATLTSERRLSKDRKINRLCKPMPLKISINLEYPEPKISTDFLGLFIDSFYNSNPFEEKA